MKRMRFILPLLLLAAVASAQTTIPVDIEIGYRWLDLKGSEGVYRSQINEGDGFLIRSLNFSTVDFNGATSMLDQFRLDVDDVGSGPAGTIRLQAGKSNSYRFNLLYRNTDLYSSIPTFALGQHTFDRSRDVIDTELQILRWNKFKPFVGYSFNRYIGPGTTTYHVGQDEFLLLSDLNDTDRETRVGTAFELGIFSGQLTHGWRHFHGTEELTLAPGANGGNNPGNVLDRPITAATLARVDRTRIDSPFTSFNISGQASKLRLTGSYSRFESDSEGDGTESATGSFASFALSRFFNGLSETTTSRAQNESWRASARAEIEIFDGYDVVAGLGTGNRELSGSALINTLFQQSVTFGGVDPRDVNVILKTSNALEREEDIINVAIVGHPKGPFSFRAGLSQSNQDVTVTPDLAEIVVDGNQGGSFARHVNSIDVGGTFAKAGFNVIASYRKDNADNPIVRTDFLERGRARLRVGYKAPKWVRAGVFAERTNLDNNHPDVGYDATVRQYGGDVEVTPFDALSLRGSGTWFRSDSSVLIRRPETFATATSINLERGKSVEAGATFTWKRLSFTGDLARFDNEGSIPFQLDRSRGRLMFNVWRQFGLAAEWAHDKYSEAPALGDYDADRYGVYLRITQ